MDISLLNQPGIYEIKNLQNGKRYIGQSENVLERLGKHISTLNDGTHDCFALQEDWDQTQEKHANFSLVALSLGQDWLEKGKRKEEEARLIGESNKEQLYNQLQQSLKDRQNYRVVFSAYGKVYSSLSEGVKNLALSETEIRRRIRSKTNFDFSFIEQIPHGYRPVIVDGNEYPSVKSLVDAGLAKNRHQALRRLSSASSKWSNWVYIDEYLYSRRG